MWVRVSIRMLIPYIENVSLINKEFRFITLPMKGNNEAYFMLLEDNQK